MKKRGFKITHIVSAGSILGFTALILGFSIYLSNIPQPQAASCFAVDGGANDNDSSADGIITISSAVVVAAASSAYDCNVTSNFHITSTGSLTLEGDESTGDIAEINFTNLQIDSGGIITADEEGCQGVAQDKSGPDGSNICSGTGNGISGDNFLSYEGGGGHGGDGGSSSHATGGESYGDPDAPVFFGATGGGSTASGGARGGHGGGVVKLNISGNMIHNGEITANGGNGANPPIGTYSGGGAGGSVYITISGTMSGTGTFSANGGAQGGAAAGHGGGGGGGRIAVYHNGGTFSPSSSNFSVDGGTGGTGNGNDGDLGTAIIEDTSTTNGDRTIYYGFDHGSEDYIKSSWIYDSSATNLRCASGAVSPSVTAGTLELGGTMNCNESTVTSFNLSASSNFSNSSGADWTVEVENIDLDWTLPGDVTFDNFTFNGPSEGELIIDDAVSIELTNGTSINTNANWTNLVNLTINDGTTLSANGTGCFVDSTTSEGPNGSNVCSGSGDGIGTSNSTSGGGAGHGGAGGASSAGASGGSTYDSSTNPVLYGATGGEGTAFGWGIPGVGGGLLYITMTGILTAEGTLSANGADARDSNPLDSNGVGGGGSGGSLNITANEIICSGGTIQANGGDGGDGGAGDGGGGGGGRICFDVSVDNATCLDGLDGSDLAIGGDGPGTALDGSSGSYCFEDSAAPTVSLIEIIDTDGDGEVDRVDVVFNESIADAELSDFDIDIYTGSSVTIASYNTAQITVVESGTPDTNATPEVTLQGDGVTDPSGNAISSGSTTATDTLGPRIVTSTPKDGGTISATGDVEINFSEPMNTGTFTYTVNPATTTSSAWSNGNQTLTISPTSSWSDSGAEITFTTAEDVNGNDLATTSENYTSPLNFFLASGGKGTVIIPSVPPSSSDGLSSVEIASGEVCIDSLHDAGMRFLYDDRTAQSVSTTMLLVPSNFEITTGFDPFDTVGLDVCEVISPSDYISLSSLSPFAVHSDATSDSIVTFTDYLDLSTNFGSDLSDFGDGLSAASAEDDLKIQGALDFEFGDAGGGFTSQRCSSSIPWSYNGSNWDYAGDDELILIAGVRFRSSTGNISATIYDTVILDPAGDCLEVSNPIDGTDPSMGISPVTGLPEKIDTLYPGNLVKAHSYSTVYYIDNQLKRHPFYDETSFKSHGFTFDQVMEVTDATLPAYSLGTPILPKPGVVLVKSQESPKVYLAEDNPSDPFSPILRWIPSESDAITLFGTDWDAFVIDIDPSLFIRYTVGENVITLNDGLTPEERTASMLRRAELAGSITVSNSSKFSITSIPKAMFAPFLRFVHKMVR